MRKFGDAGVKLTESSASIKRNAVCITIGDNALKIRVGREDVTFRNLGFLQFIYVVTFYKLETDSLAAALQDAQPEFSTLLLSLFSVHVTCHTIDQFADFLSQQKKAELTEHSDTQGLHDDAMTELQILASDKKFWRPLTKGLFSIPRTMRKCDRILRSKRKTFPEKVREIKVLMDNAHQKPRPFSKKNRNKTTVAPFYEGMASADSTENILGLINRMR